VWKEFFRCFCLSTSPFPAYRHTACSNSDTNSRDTPEGNRSWNILILIRIYYAMLMFPCELCSSSLTLFLLMKSRTSDLCVVFLSFISQSPPHSLMALSLFCIFHLNDSEFRCLYSSNSSSHSTIIWWQKKGAKRR
jgi:hypothetical protein